MIIVDLTQYLPETMPERCEDCPFLREEANDDYNYIRLFCGLINEDFYQGSFWPPYGNVDFNIEKLEDCPLREVEDITQEIDKEEAEYQEWVKNLETVYKDDLGLEFNIVGDMLITDPIFGRGIDLRRAYFKKEEGVWRMEVGE